MDNKYKRCNKCDKDKSLNEFSETKRTKDGFQNWCKECVSIYDKEYRKKNINRILQLI